MGPGALSLEAEALVGRRAALSLERRFGGVAHEPTGQCRMVKTGERLAKCLPAGSRRWQYAVLTSDQVNAFSLPGGLIYVTRGLYDRIGADDELLAAVLAHEMSHVMQRDSLKPPCACARDSLAREIEADAGAAVLLRAAGSSAEPLSRLLALTADVQPAGWAEERRARFTGTVSPEQPVVQLAAGLPEPSAAR